MIVTALRWIPENLANRTVVFGSGKQQAITWANIDRDLCGPMAYREHVYSEFKCGVIWLR